MLFVCETDAQITNAINIREYLRKGEEADLCYCDTSGRKSYIAERIGKYGIFNNVFVCNPKSDRNQSMTTKIRKSVRYVFHKDYIGSYLTNKDETYSEVFVAGPSMNSVGVYYYFKRKNKSIKLSLYEEGVFEYYMFTYKKNFLRRIYSNIVFGRYYLDHADNLYVYDPKLVLGKPDSVRAIKIPKIKNTDMHLRKVYNDLFMFPDSICESLVECKYLFLEQAFPDEEENKKQLELVRLITDTVGKDKLLVKLHPVSQLDKYDDIGVSSIKTPVSMEMLALNYNLDNLTLISICSSAVFNFELVFERKMDIVLLYKLFDEVTVDGGVKAFIDRFIEENSDLRILVPCTADELTRGLQLLYRK